MFWDFSQPWNGFTLLIWCCVIWQINFLFRSNLKKTLEKNLWTNMSWVCFYTITIFTADNWWRFVMNGNSWLSCLVCRQKGAKFKSSKNERCFQAGLWLFLWAFYLALYRIALRTGFGNWVFVLMVVNKGYYSYNVIQSSNNN